MIGTLPRSRRVAKEPSPVGPLMAREIGPLLRQRTGESFVTFVDLIAGARVIARSTECSLMSACVLCLGTLNITTNSSLVNNFDSDEFF